MKKQTVLVAALLVALSLVGGAASAQAANLAPRWKVEGAFLGSGTTKTFTATSTNEMLFGSAILNLFAPAGKCSISGTLVGTAAEVPGVMKEVVLKCTGTSVVGSPPPCTVHAGSTTPGTLMTDRLTGKLVWLAKTGGAAGLLVRTEVGTEIANIVTESPCVPAEYLLTGEAIAKMLPVETETTTGQVVFPLTTAGECNGAAPILHYWSNAATRVEQTAPGLALKTSAAALCNTYSLKLGTGQKYGIYPG